MKTNDTHSFAMLGMTAGALLVFYRFETTYSTARLSAAIARVMCYFAWSVLGSLAARASHPTGDSPEVCETATA
jgi:hypothetical protein